MMRWEVFLLLALAALAQASIPSNNAGGAAKVALRRASAILDRKAPSLCDQCQTVVQVLIDVENNSTLQQTAQEYLEHVCLTTFQSQYEKCMRAVEDVTLLVRTLLKLVHDPLELCKLAKLCPYQTAGFGTVSKTLALSAAAKLIQEVHKPAGTLEFPEPCDLCKNAITKLENILENPEYVHDIEVILHQLCESAGPVFSKECNRLVDKLFPKIVQWILDHICQPEETCEALHLCKPQSAIRYTNGSLSLSHFPHIQRLVAKINQVQAARGINFGCAACKSTVAAGIKFLSTEKMLDLISNDVTQTICTIILPSTLEAGCLDFMNIYFKTAVYFTLHEWTPTEICDRVHICHNGSGPHQISSRLPIVGSAITCDTCKVLTKVLAYELQQPGLQQDIVNLLTGACNLLPGKYANKCGNAVIEYVPFGLSYVADFVSRDDVCTILHLC